MAPLSLFLPSITTQAPLSEPKIECLNAHLANKICAHLGLKDLLNLRAVCTWTFPAKRIITLAKAMGNPKDAPSEAEAAEFLAIQIAGIDRLVKEALIIKAGEIDYLKTLDKLRSLKEEAFLDVYRNSSFTHTLREAYFLSQFSCYPADVRDNMQRSPLVCAVETGDVEAVKFLLDNDDELFYGQHVQTQERWEEEIRYISPLHLAAQKGHVPIMALLVDYFGFTAINFACFVTKITPLHCAAESNNPKAVLFLLEKGALYLSKDSNGDTPLHYAARLKNVDAMRVLIEHVKCCNEEFFEIFLAARNFRQATPLDLASSIEDSVQNESDPSRDPATAVAMLLNYSSLSAENTLQSAHILHSAAESGNDEFLNANLKRMQSSLPEEEFQAFLSNHVSKNMDSSLHKAARKQHTETVNVLLHYGASIRVMNKREQTPLHLAVQAGAADITGILLEHANSLFWEDRTFFTNWISAKDALGQTPLKCAVDYAISRRYPDTYIIEMLLSYGADPDLGDISGETPLHNAIKEEDKESLKLALAASTLLLEKGANPNALTVANLTPLHYAAENHRAGIIKKLFEKGALPNERTLNGETPLHMAASAIGSDGSQFLETFRLLLEMGADPNAENEDQQTPLHYLVNLAIPQRYVKRNQIRVEAIRMLLDKGAITILTDNKGKSPVQYAYERMRAADVDALFFPELHNGT